VYELSTTGAKFIGHRRVDLYCQGGYGEDDSLETIIRAINDCHAVFVAKIGGCPKADLLKAGIEPVEQYAHEFIEKSAITWFKDYLGKVKAGEVAHAARGDALIRQGGLTAEAVAA
jgi:nitrogen fixation protein NifB